MQIEAVQRVRIVGRGLGEAQCGDLVPQDRRIEGEKLGLARRCDPLLQRLGHRALDGIVRRRRCAEIENDGAALREAGDEAEHSHD